MVWTWVKRVFFVAIAGGVGTLTAVGFGDVRSPLPVPAQEIADAIDRPLTAPSAELPVVDRGEVAVVGSRARVDLTVPAGECAFVRVGAATPEPMRSLTLFDSDTHTPLVFERDERTAALGWCAADEPRAITLWAQAPELFDSEVEGSIVYRTHIGPPTQRWQDYIVGEADPASLAELTTARLNAAGEARDAANAPAGRALIRTDVGPQVALAIPMSGATRWVAAELATLGLPPEGHDPRLQSADGTTTGSDSPTALLDGQRARLLAVLDPADLPMGAGQTRCARVHFSRLAENGLPVLRLPIPSLDPTEDTEHLLCPSDPPTAFVTDADDEAQWRVRVLPAPGDPEPRQPSAIPEERLVARAHVQALERCAANEPEACGQVARNLENGRFVPRDEAAALPYALRACRAEATECGLHGDMLAARGNHGQAFGAWQRACTVGDHWSCAQLGEAYRLGRGTAFDARAALQMYVAACNDGVAIACDRKDTMALLGLDS